MAERMSLSTFKRVNISPSTIDKYSAKMPKLKKVPYQGHVGAIWVNAEDKIVAFVNVEDDKGKRRKIQSIFLDKKYKGEGLYSQLIEYARNNFRATDINISNKDAESIRLFTNLGFHKISTGDVTSLFSTIKPGSKTDKNIEYKPMFVILTHASYGFANFVKFMTHATYSHSSIAFDTGLKEVYSFASRGKEHTLVPLGFTEENLIYFLKKDPECKFALYAMFVPVQDYATMKSKVLNFKENKTQFGYDIAGVVKNFFGKRSMNDKNKFCSGFVSEILNSGSKKITHKESDMMRPEDIPDIPNIHFIDAGLLRNYDKKEIDKRVDAIYQKHYAKKTTNKE